MNPTFDEFDATITAYRGRVKHVESKEFSGVVKIVRYTIVFVFDSAMDQRRSIYLYDEKDALAAVIYLLKPEAYTGDTTIGFNFSGVPEMNGHVDHYPHIVDLLRNESPIYFTYSKAAAGYQATLKTGSDTIKGGAEPVGEGE